MTKDTVEVPINPTSEMMAAGLGWLTIHPNMPREWEAATVANIYAAMLGAAQNAKTKPSNG